MAKKRSTAKYAGIPEPSPSGAGLRGRPYVRKCSAIRRDGARCQAPAMRGKEVCRVHGGKAGRKPKHGAYAYDVRRLSGDLAARFREHLANENLGSLDEEIALLRTYLEQYLATQTPSSSQHPPPLTSDFFAVLLGFTTRLSRLAKTKAEIEWGPQHQVTATQFMAVLDTILEGVVRFVSDPAEVEAVFDYVESRTGLTAIKQSARLALPAPGETDEGQD